jgi:hypothetical protein
MLSQLYWIKFLVFTIDIIKPSHPTNWQLIRFPVGDKNLGGSQQQGG